MVALNFNAQGVDPNVALEPVPSGSYPVIITKTEMKPTKNTDGAYLEIEMTIQGGQFANRKLYDRLNLQNRNETAVNIAYQTLSAICHVTGRLQVADSSQLHGIPFQAVVIKRERNDQAGVFTNEVRGYKDIHGNDPGKSGQISQPAAAPQWAAPAQPGVPGPAPQAPMPQPQPQYQPPQAPNGAPPAPPAWGAPPTPAPQPTPAMPQQPQWAAPPAPQPAPQAPPPAAAAPGGAPPWTTAG